MNGWEMGNGEKGKSFLWPRLRLGSIFICHWPLFLGKTLIFFSGFSYFSFGPPAPVVVAAFFMMFAHSLLVPPRF